MPRTVVQGTPEMHPPLGTYSHATIAEGGRLVFLGGQVPVDRNGNPVGEGDYRAQLTQVMENIRLALQASGATFKDVVTRRTFVTRMDEFLRNMSWACEQWPDFWGSKPQGRVPDDAPSGTLIEVARLAYPQFMLEIDCVAHIR